MIIAVIILVIVIIFIFRAANSNSGAKNSIQANQSGMKIVENALLSGSTLGALGELLTLTLREGIQKNNVYIREEYPEISEIQITLELGSIIYLAIIDGIRNLPDNCQEEVRRVFLQRQGLSPEVQRRVVVYSYILDKRETDTEGKILLELGKAFADGIRKHEDSTLIIRGEGIFLQYRDLVLKMFQAGRDSIEKIK